MDKNSILGIVVGLALVLALVTAQVSAGRLDLLPES